MRHTFFKRSVSFTTKYSYLLLWFVLKPYYKSENVSRYRSSRPSWNFTREEKQYTTGENNENLMLTEGREVWTSIVQAPRVKGRKTSVKMTYEPVADDAWTRGEEGSTMRGLMEVTPVTNFTSQWVGAVAAENRVWCDGVKRQQLEQWWIGNRGERRLEAAEWETHRVRVYTRYTVI